MTRDACSQTSRQASRRNRRTRAFTLVEMVATITIIATLITVVSPLILTSMDSYASSAIRAEMVSASSTCLERVTAEVRQIPLRAGQSSAKPAVDSVTSSSIMWSTNSSIELSGTDLQLTIAGGTPRLLLSNVAGFVVQTYDESNTALAALLSGSACDAIRRVQFTITVTRGGVTETLRTRVFLRCMRSGALP